MCISTYLYFGRATESALVELQGSHQGYVPTTTADPNKMTSDGSFLVLAEKEFFIPIITNSAETADLGEEHLEEFITSNRSSDISSNIEQGCGGKCLENMLS